MKLLKKPDVQPAPIADELTREQKLDVVLNSEPVRAEAIKHPTKVAGERRELVAALTKLEDAAEAAYPQRRAEEAAAVDAVIAAERSLHEAQKMLNATRAKISTASFAHTGQVDAIDAQLRETASPLIRPFVRAMRDEIQHVRKIAPDVGIGVGGVPVPSAVKNPITGKMQDVPRAVGSTRYERILARMEACRAAIEEAEQMHRTADQSAVADRLSQLRAGLPVVD